MSESEIDPGVMCVLYIHIRTFRMWLKAGSLDKKAMGLTEKVANSELGQTAKGYQTPCPKGFVKQ